MTFQKQRIALLGPGAVGLYYGGLLATSGQELHVLARSDAAALMAEGIRMSKVNAKSAEVLEKQVIHPASVATEAAAIGPVDLVLVAAKSTVNDELVEPLKALVEPRHTTILTLQNGMGNAEFYARYFTDNPILSGLCFVCVNRVAAGVVENYHPGRVEIGSFDDRWPELANSLVHAFSLAGISTKFSPVLDAALWRKLCWNVPFNGLSIVGGALTCDQILADTALKARALGLMEELRSVAASFGHSISERFLEGQFEVTEKMGAYQPSSLIDYLENRPVEVEAIWGEPLRRGQAAGFQLPELSKLHQELLVAVEKRGG